MAKEENSIRCPCGHVVSGFSVVGKHTMTKRTWEGCLKTFFPQTQEGEKILRCSKPEEGEVDTDSCITEDDPMKKSDSMVRYEIASTTRISHMNSNDNNKTCPKPGLVPNLALF